MDLFLSFSPIADLGSSSEHAHERPVQYGDLVLLVLWRCVLLGRSMLELENYHTSPSAWWLCLYSHSPKNDICSASLLLQVFFFGGAFV